MQCRNLGMNISSSNIYAKNICHKEPNETLYFRVEISLTFVFGKDSNSAALLLMNMLYISKARWKT